MSVEAELVAAIALDLALGDPRKMPHIVKMMGAAAAWMEPVARRSIPNKKSAGVIAALSLIGASVFAAWGIIGVSSIVSIYLSVLVAVILLYQCVALRDLGDHAMNVYRVLDENDIIAARNNVAMMVGRDTATLDEEGISRACIESVAENLVDGITAPIFFAAIGGAVAAVAYKAASTLDSMFGHKNERYVDFGWASARIDDVANFIPARLTPPVIALAALILGYNAPGSLAVWRRDGSKHESPNSGQSEAAFAGALGIKLGGPRSYSGEVSENPFMGDGGYAPSKEKILEAVKLAYATSLIFAAIALVARMAIVIFYA